MSKPASGSRVSALFTLGVVAAMIAVVVFYAVQWTGNVARVDQQKKAQPAAQSPDLQNISDQFDEL